MLKISKLGRGVSVKLITKGRPGKPGPMSGLMLTACRDYRKHWTLRRFIVAGMTRRGFSTSVSLMAGPYFVEVEKFDL